MVRTDSAESLRDANGGLWGEASGNMTLASTIFGVDYELAVKWRWKYRDTPFSSHNQQNLSTTYKNSCYFWHRAHKEQGSITFNQGVLASRINSIVRLKAN